MLVDCPPAPVLSCVELTIDGLLVCADTLGGRGNDFPLVLGVGGDNIFDDVLRAHVWSVVAQDLAGQKILTATGDVDPRIAELIVTVTEPDRTLECRWWRNKEMIRFAVCRRGQHHVIAARRGDMLVLQPVAASVGLAGMVEAVIDVADPAPMTSTVTGPVEVLSGAWEPHGLSRWGCDAASAATLRKATQQQCGWVHVVATETLPGGTVARPEPGLGVLDGAVGRIVSAPKMVGQQLHASFMPGNRVNLGRGLDMLVALLPSHTWHAHAGEGQ